MATNPKMRPCPYCDRVDDLAVYDYDGWIHVECVACDYLGPGCSSVRWAIKNHNAERDDRRAEHLLHIGQSAALPTQEPSHE